MGDAAVRGPTVREYTMNRVYVVTGSASGIGKATSELLMEQGHRVIGVDVAGADVAVDLGTPAGRSDLVEQVTSISGGRIDAVLAVAGLASPISKTVAVNYVGTIATLEGMRPLLAGSPAPRAVAVRCSRRTTLSSTCSLRARRLRPWRAEMSWQAIRRRPA